HRLRRCAGDRGAVKRRRRARVPGAGERRRAGGGLRRPGRNLRRAAGTVAGSVAGAARARHRGRRAHPADLAVLRGAAPARRAACAGAKVNAPGLPLPLREGVGGKEPRPNPTLPALFLSFLTNGSTSFGGGLLGWIRRELVERRRWIDDQQF